MGIGNFSQSLTFQDRRLESGRTKYSNKNVQRTGNITILEYGMDASFASHMPIDIQRSLECPSSMNAYRPCMEKRPYLIKWLVTGVACSMK
ncbi:hypothetical protein TNCV_975671 [Trichonephila clavipes]|nr:hypothetical protein TNCV_975671 [Trichonephila clavipes]